MAPELRLSVGLDLAFFRQQMRKAVNIAQSEFTAQLRVKINRDSLQRETENLTRYFRRKNYRINVNTNLDAEIKKARELTQALAGIDRALKAPAVAATRGGLDFSRFLGTKGQGTQVGLEDLKKLYKAAANAGLTEYKNAAVKNKASIVKELEKIGEDSFIGFLNGLDSQDDKIKNAVKSLGSSLLETLKTELGIASPSKKFKKIGEDSGEGFEKGLEKGLDEAKSMGIGQIRELFKALQGEAKAGATQLSAVIAASMAGVIRLPGGRQQAGQIRQAGGPINAAMTGRAFGNIRARQSMMRSQVGSASAATPSFLAALPLLMGMSERELTARMGGLYGQSFNAPRLGTPNVMARTNIVNQLARARGGLGGGAAISRPFTGAGTGPAISPTGYIGRSALSPQFANYPIGMQGAYASAGFGGGTPSSRFDFGANIRGLLPAAGMTARQAMFAARTARAQARGGSVGEHFMQAPKGLLPSAEMQSAARTLRDFSAVTAQAMERIRRADAARARGGSTGEFFGAGGRGGGRGQLMLPGGVSSNVVSSRGRLGRVWDFIAGNDDYEGAGGGGGRGGGRPPGGGLTPPSGPGGFRGLNQRLSGLKQAMAPLQQARLPLTGAVAELGGEFGNAIKQVLLFGTAYKALAFILDIPAQAFEAARSLASFENQLMAITDGGPAFEQSLQFISDTVQRFNVPLESARTGFARLYASMEPAGIDQGTIEGLFTGVSQAAATLSLTPDQVDRVTYAFSQMASKGKIMSEEVTGQLGDVIPGALSLMADAAGMSMAEFKDAMEKGQLSGDAMGQVFNNLAIVFDERFGKGAEGAAKTLQGAITNINNSLQLMYEALSPIVNQFAQAFGPKIQSLIKDVTDVFTVLSGNFIDTADAAKALSPRAMAIYQAIEQLRPAVQNAASSIASLGQFFLQLSPAIVGVTTAALQFLNTNLGRGLIVFTGAVGALTAAFGVLKATGLAPTITALYNFIAAMTAAQAKQFAVWIAGLTRNMLGLRNAFRAARVSAVLFTGALTALATAGISLVIAGIANAMLDVGDNARQAASDVAQLKKQLDGIAGAGDVAAAQAVLTTKQGVEQAANLQIAVRRRELEEAKKRRGATAGVGVALAEQNLRDAEAAYARAVDERVDAERTVRNAERVAGERATAALPPRQEVTLGGGEDGKAGKGSKKELKDYDADLQQFYDNEFKIRSAAIEQDFNLTEREKELAIAREKFRTDELKAQAQYNRDLGKLQEYKPDQRAFAKAGLDVEKEQRLNLAAIDFTRVALGETIKEAENQAETQKELRTQIKLLTEGREELTEVEKIENLIKEETKGLDAEIIKGMQEKHNALRESARLTDNLRQEVEKLLEAEKARKEVEQAETTIRNRLSMARAVLPGQEIREKLRQQLGASATPEKIEELAQLEELAIKAEEIKAVYQNVAQTIGDAFGQAFQDVVNGSKGMQEALSSMLQSIGQSFVAMAAQIIAKQVTMVALGAILKALGISMGGSFGGGAQIGEQVKMPTGVGFGAGGGILQNSGGQGFGTLGPNFGIRQFANGGIVNGPTLGLVGEGRYNEAIVPLPDGKSIPVQMRNQRSSRELLSAKEQREKMSPTVLSMNFETTNINGVEYVSREQLEQAMAQTRKEAAREGASQGSRLTLDKIKNSPSTRRQLGIR